uniref:NAD-dependent epimerase/dehydratase domain-containing protein n=1 Tax=Ananas comosus var. bracteatus TaxID=296719 RepID=A0A6V7QJF5_ANACO|nr:unnamed protein product [Ananas comosus var. bracteatus]
MEERISKVCVTGASGYIGSWLVKKLLEKGYQVHATIRNLVKCGLLKNIPESEGRLSLFEADIYDSKSFEPAIKGCDFVFLVATPLQHSPCSSQYKDTTEAAVDAIHTILRLCDESGSVKRVIYTGSVTAASPLKEDGTGFNNFIDESCWTPLDVSYAHSEDHEKAYVSSKTLSEKAVLSYNDDRRSKGSKLEVVSLACGLVGGGNTILPYTPLSVRVIVAPLTGEEICHRQLMFLQALLGSVPLIHIDDVCEAHIFCMERPSIAGRFLCAAGYPAMQECVDYFVKEFPGIKLIIKEVEGEGARVKPKSQKLVDLGFRYRYSVEEILNESVRCAEKMGSLKNMD